VTWADDLSPEALAVPAYNQDLGHDIAPPDLTQDSPGPKAANAELPDESACPAIRSQAEYRAIQQVAECLERVLEADDSAALDLPPVAWSVLKRSVAQQLEELRRQLAEREGRGVSWTTSG
jgi:hypothetical protein